MADEYKVVSEGSLLGNRWKIKRRVGRGTFSEIYEASDQHSARDATGRHPHQAIKVARDTHAKCSMLVHEQEVLRELQDSQWIPRYVELGKEDECQFLVMQLLGDNLSELRRTTPTKRFTLRTVALLGIQMVEAIREMHELGFVHRDIKPSNFCVGLPKIEDAEGATADGEEGRCYILDFGLMRPRLLACRPLLAPAATPPREGGGGPWTGEPGRREKATRPAPAKRYPLTLSSAEVDSTSILGSMAQTLDFPS